ARRATRDFRQHEVEDVVGEVVLARGYEYLGARDLVDPAVARRLGLGADLAQIRAAMRLGQAHGTAPGAVGELRQVALLERFGAVLLERAVGAVGEAWIHPEGEVGRADHLLDEGVKRARQALTAVLGIAAERGPPTLTESIVSLLEALGRAHHAILESAA